MVLVMEEVTEEAAAAGVAIGAVAAWVALLVDLSEVVGWGEVVVGEVAVVWETGQARVVIAAAVMVWVTDSAAARLVVTGSVGLVVRYSHTISC